jgi:predicted aspartyl protease
MRKQLGTFRYPVGLRWASRDAFEDVEPRVDTGALYSQFPSSLLERLGHAPNAKRLFKLADGSTSEMPIGDVPIKIGDEVHSVICLFGEEGSDPVLGATTLEVFSLAADPVNETLNPIVALRL